jgi:transcriptional regulator with XRE-family HTH domain
MSKTEKQFVQAFGKRVAKLRQTKKFSQEELADRSNLHAVAITYIETRKRKPGITSIYKLAKGLGVSVSDLFKDL